MNETLKWAIYNLGASLVTLLALLLAVPVVAGDLQAVRRVVDGDTIIMQSGERVRLLSINSPELHHPRRGREPYGEEAKACLVDILDGQRVRLEIGTEPLDRYGRTLAHVFTEKGVHVNKELLRRGCAKLMVIGTNVGHLDELVDAQAKAHSEKRGLWDER